MNGEALDLFSAGRYTLETQNIPLVGKLLKLPTGGVSPFHCEVYFINKTEQMAIKWGTDSKVQYVEPTYGFPISIGASGEMSLRVEDSRKLLLKLVGTEKSLSQSVLANYFRAFLMTRVKTYLATTVKEKKLNIFEIDEQLDLLSDDLKTKLYTDFIQYGTALERFFVTTIVKPDGDDNYEKFKSLHFRQYADIAEAKLRQQVGVIDQETEAQKMVIESKGMAEKRQIEGYSYQQERGFDVAEKVAGNEGSGNMANLGIGLGMMAGIGGGVGSAVGGVFNEALDGMKQNTSVVSNNKFCDNCGTVITAGAAFCDECGASAGQAGCSKCGFVFEKPGKFCPKCGTKREG